jgi:hypothetical protein
MVVRFNAAAQRSDRIHGEARRMKGRGNPITGENICASLSVTDSGVDCGTVRNGNVSWASDHGFIIRGADHDGITAQRVAAALRCGAFLARRTPLLPVSTTRALADLPR